MCENMYVCVDVYMYIYIYIYTYSYRHACMHACIYTYMYTCHTSYIMYVSVAGYSVGGEPHYVSLCDDGSWGGLTIISTTYVSEHRETSMTCQLHMQLCLAFRATFRKVGCRNARQTAPRLSARARARWTAELAPLAYHYYHYYHYYCYHYY